VVLLLQIKHTKAVFDRVRDQSIYFKMENNKMFSAQQESDIAELMGTTAEDLKESNPQLHEAMCNEVNTCSAC